jgi:hypothetical protein
MAPNRFVQLKLVNKTSDTVRISTEECSDVHDFKGITRMPFTKKLKPYDPGDIFHFEADGITTTSPMDSIEQLSGRTMPLVVKVESGEIEVNPVPKPLIGSPRHKEYKTSRSHTLSPAFLTSIAEELAKIYPIPFHETESGPYVTIDHVFSARFMPNPEPNPEFKGRYERLNDFFTNSEWNLLTTLCIQRCIALWSSFMTVIPNKSSFLCDLLRARDYNVKE